MKVDDRKLNNSMHQRYMQCIFLWFCLMVWCILFFYFYGISSESSITAVGKAEIKTKINNTMSQPNTKVLIIAHMRGGSTFLSDLFNMNDEACNWCEPIDPMFHAMYGCSSQILPADVHFTPAGERKLLTAYERRHLVLYILQLLGDTAAEDIAPEILYSGSVLSKPSRWALPFRKCVAMIHRKYPYCTELSCTTMARCHVNDTETHTDLKDQLAVNSSLCPKLRIKCHYGRMVHLKESTKSCFKYADDSCMKKSIKAIKSIRLPLSIAEDVLAKDPSVKIIYNIRDPRGIYISRLNGPWWVDSKVNHGNRLLDIKYVCKLMDEDYLTLKRLQKHYPENILLTKYEDFAKYPQSIAEHVYNYVGRTLHNSVKDWLRSSTNASKDSGYIETRRANSTKTAYAWRDKIKISDHRTINEHCRQTLKAFGYPEYI